jgi:RNA polymerase sigma-70 factor (sigma-E family)
MARRDAAAFADFAAARGRALYRAAYLMLGDHALAEDLVQEALTKTYVAWPRLRRVESAEAYTRKIIATTAISWWRRRSWDAEQPRDDVPDVVVRDHSDRLADQDAMWTELQALPPRQRAAIVLRFYEDLSERQTADAMGCSVGTVKSQVFAGLEKLRARLGPGSVPITTTELGVGR